MSPLYLIDGFNFLHAVVLKGRDRAHWWSIENQRAVRDWVAEHAIVGARTWIIFDQRERRAEPAASEPAASDEPSTPTAAGGPEVRHAPDADAQILAFCADLRQAWDIVVVSADRSLVDRARRHGARSLSPWDFARYAAAQRATPATRE